ncbi:methyltransferase family protein [Scleromatobacter humisilvae]|uniref:Isoprenylcysteine carboxylmethyltransferase family protein n=1 Tax=Scleromatobacter humisilvae TaxID=2897159 RepID=A0A9X1YLD9_9BURK|nr:isoprenylcysteine carboxylmethyltransferase family protein [Scleromatobacter humisilvae]MCK9687882.1 isoprenylcysteine carboxylmethyltransferase family protein [Scleromatobacter humisilvae]
MTLPLPTPPMLFAFMLAGEIWLMRSRLSGDVSRQADRGSLRLLIAIILVSAGLAWAAKRRVPQAGFEALLGVGPGAVAALHWAGLVLFVAGLCLRWYSIRYLGRLFTFDVAVADDHRVIDSGPYRRIRHPSYTGALMAYAGLGLCSGNLLSLVVLVTPIALAFLHRIAVEEAALTAALGSRYADYAGRTKRLVPFVY